MSADDTARTDGPTDTVDNLVAAITEARQSAGGQRHWSTEFDEDDEPYGELCWCTDTGGEDH